MTQAIEGWQMDHGMQEAMRLFGLWLGCSNNQETVATALVEIANILKDNDDVEITVKRVASGVEHLEKEKQHDDTK